MSLYTYMDSGVSLVLFMVHFSPIIQQQKQVNNCKANDVGLAYVYEYMDESFMCLRALINKSLT